MSMLVFKDIYNIREKIAMKCDLQKDSICQDVDILLLARKRPATIDQFLKTLKTMSMEKENLMDRY